MEAIGKTGMVPVFYHADAEIAKQVQIGRASCRERV